MPSTRGVAISFSQSKVLRFSLVVRCRRMCVTRTGASTYVITVARGYLDFRSVPLPRPRSASCGLVNITAVC